MCTAISVTTKKHWFGRNLDYEYEFGEKIVITPRNFPFVFSNGESLSRHSALIGMGLCEKNFPLYFDAANEDGLAMAGLNFSGNACYMPKTDNKTNIASFEFIPWVLTHFKTANDAARELPHINITDTAFSKDLAPSPLHWLIADKSCAFVIEQTERGLTVFENPVGVLTNNPPFDFQLFNLKNYLSVTRNEPENRFCNGLDLEPYSRGMGGLGLPGDLSSSSRFVRAAFTKLNSVFGRTDNENIAQFFHILNSVYQQNGCARVGDSFEKTNYSSCIDTENGIYYYTTYANPTINAVSMTAENLECKELLTYERKNELFIFSHNKKQTVF